MSVTGMVPTRAEGQFRAADGERGLTHLNEAAMLASVPASSSAVVDAADPHSPIPSGGGARADVGAVGLGAPRLPDGTYCTPP